MKLLVTVFMVAAILLAAPPVSCSDDTRPLVHALSNAPWPPYYTYPDGAQGEPGGLFAELVDILFVQELGMEVDLLLLPWKRAQHEVEVGKADFMVTVPTPARDEYAYTTIIPLHRMYLHLYMYTDHPKAKLIPRIRNAKDIKGFGLTLAANLGDGWYREHIAPIGIKTHYLAQDENIVRFVAAKRADGMIDALLTTNTKIKDLNLESELMLTDVRFGPLDFHVLISRKSPLMERVEDINAALLRMRENGVFDRLMEKYGASLPH